MPSNDNKYDIKKINSSHYNNRDNNCPNDKETLEFTACSVNKIL